MFITWDYRKVYAKGRTNAWARMITPVNQVTPQRRLIIRVPAMVKARVVIRLVDTKAKVNRSIPQVPMVGSKSPMVNVEMTTNTPVRTQDPTEMTMNRIVAPAVETNILMTIMKAPTIRIVEETSILHIMRVHTVGHKKLMETDVTKTLIIRIHIVDVTRPIILQDATKIHIVKVSITTNTH